MAPSSSPSIRPGTAAYRDLLADLESCGEQGECMAVLLAGGNERDVQQLLGDVTEAASHSVHQFDVRKLVGERAIQTQGNLREVFDSTSGEAAILVFEHVDALVQGSDEAPQAETPNEDDDTLRPIDYLFDRIHAYAGVVVLHLADAALTSGLTDKVDAVIEP